MEAASGSNRRGPAGKLEFGGFTRRQRDGERHGGAFGREKRLYMRAGSAYGGFPARYVLFYSPSFSVLIISALVSRSVSTTSAAHRAPQTPRTLGQASGPSSRGSLPSGSSAPGSSHRHHHHGAAPPPTLTRAVPFNPFFDNIRQNLELAGGITERIPLHIPAEVLSRCNDMPFEWLRDMVGRNAEETVEALAMQFYRIELGEQRRLQGVMEHHSRDSGAAWEDHVRREQEKHKRVSDREKAKRKAKDNSLGDCEGDVEDTPFPYSITAGIEQGSKNRYVSLPRFSEIPHLTTSISFFFGCG